MDLESLLEGKKSIILQVSLADLKEFALTIYEEAERRAKQNLEQNQSSLTADPYLTSDEVMKRLHVITMTLWRLKKKGLLNPVKIGRKNLYKLSEIEHLLEGGRNAIGD